MTRHSHEDALDTDTYRRLLNAAQELDRPFDAECTFVLVAAGRLGLRAGEIAHIREEWVDWNRKMIEIPHHEPCECSYCEVQAAQMDGYDTPKTFEEAIDEMWSPKSEASARTIPFDFDEEVASVVHAFFEIYDEYPRSRASVNRRVDRVLDAAGLPQDTCYPHSLRATAASHHAYRGLPTPALRDFMGWVRTEAAEDYVQKSGRKMAKALKEVHSD